MAAEAARKRLCRRPTPLIVEAVVLSSHASAWPLSLFILTTKAVERVDWLGSGVSIDSMAVSDAKSEFASVYRVMLEPTAGDEEESTATLCKRPEFLRHTSMDHILKMLDKEQIPYIERCSPEEEAILRQELRNGVQAKWVRSEQMLADTLTKELTGKGSGYARMVFESGLRTLGPDDCCSPSTRGRKLQDPHAGTRVQTQQEADMLSQKVSQFVKKDDNEDDMDTAISTLLITKQTETVDIYFVHEIDSKAEQSCFISLAIVVSMTLIFICLLSQRSTAAC
jgi:hypothetical protein